MAREPTLDVSETVARALLDIDAGASPIEVLGRFLRHHNVGTVAVLALLWVAVEDVNRGAAGRAP